MPADLPFHRPGRRIGPRLTLLIGLTTLLWAALMGSLFSEFGRLERVGLLLFAVGASIPLLICLGLRFWRLQIGDDGLRIFFGPFRYVYAWSKVTKVMISAEPHPIFEFKTGIGGQLVIDTTTAADPAALAAELSLAHALYRPEALPGRDKPDFSYDLSLLAFLAILPIFFLPPASNWISAVMNFLTLQVGVPTSFYFFGAVAMGGIYLVRTFDGPHGLHGDRQIERVEFSWIWRCGRPFERLTIHCAAGRPVRLDSRAVKYRRYRDTLLQVLPSSRCQFLSPVKAVAQANRRTGFFIVLCLTSSTMIWLLKPAVTNQSLAYWVWAVAPLVFVLFMVRWMIWRKRDAALLSYFPGTTEPASEIRKAGELHALVDERFRDAKVIKKTAS